jgi:hypothetical protein
MHYETVADYLKAYAADPASNGILPIPLVAEHLGKSSPAVTAMLKAETLTEISIGARNRFIAIASLLEREAGEQGQEDVVWKYLVNMIQTGQRSEFYEPVMSEVGMSTTMPWHRTRMGVILDAVSMRSYKEHGVVISVLVHRKAPGTYTRPGPGFWTMVEREGLFDEATMTKDTFVREHTDAVIKAYR